jgi:chromosome segregation ATPase
MPDPDDDLEPRVSALESDVGELRARVERSEQDAAAARVLAGGADRDVSEIRTEIREFREQNMRLHNATREDIVDIRAEIAETRTGLRAEIAELREHTDRGFAQIRGLLDAAAAGQQRIVDLLTHPPEADESAAGPQRGGDQPATPAPASCRA